MKKICTLFILLSFFVFTPVFGQLSLFSKVYEDPTGSVQVYAMEKTIDGNLILAGARNGNAMAMKIDTGGNVLWLKKIGDYYGEEFYAVANTHDSGFVLAGQIFRNGISQMSCVKINPAGDTLFCKAIDLTTNSWALSVAETYDHGFILCGGKSSNTSPYTQIALVKIDTSGNLEWSRLLSSNTYDFAYSVKETTDSGFIIAGGDLYVQQRASLIKTDALGSILWAKQIFNGYSDGIDVIEVDSALFYLSYKDGVGPYLTKLSLSGNLIWNHQYNSYAQNFYSPPYPKPKLHFSSDGGFYFTDGYNPFYGGNCIETDFDGNLLWSGQIFLQNADMVEISPKVFMIAGNGPLWGMKSKLNYWQPQIGITRTDSTFNLFCTGLPLPVDSNKSMSVSAVNFTSINAGTLHAYTPTVTNEPLSFYDGCVDIYSAVEESSEIEIIISPNPGTGIFQIGIKGANSLQLENISVYNITGEKVWQCTPPAFINQRIIDICDQADGIYIVRIICNNKVFTQRLVKCR